MSFIRSYQNQHKQFFEKIEKCALLPLIRLEIIAREHILEKVLRSTTNVSNEAGQQIVIARGAPASGNWKRDTVTWGVSSGLVGHTLFPLYNLPGKDDYNALFSRGTNTHAVFAYDLSTDDIIKTMHHEIRHIYLGDFGRDLLRGNHPFATSFTSRAEAEADENMKRK